MGIYRDYIDKKLDAAQLDTERKKQLKKISELLNADVLTYAARLAPVPIALPLDIQYEDLLSFHDLLSGLKKKSIAVILETGGGSGETARDMVDALHERFEHVTFIVPGMAKSAGTIMVLGGHDILMGTESALGPIDAQIRQPSGKVISADALVEGFERVKQEVTSTGKLNAAYIPLLQQISPGEIQSAINALDFARVTVRDWLTRFKFADWDKHSSTGKPVTEDEKKVRAAEISTALSSQARWHTHGRSIRIPELTALRVKVTDYGTKPHLAEAIRRYYTLLRMTFDAGNAFKIFETPAETIARRFQQVTQAVPNPSIQGLLQGGAQVPTANIEVDCGKCHQKTSVQLDFMPGIPLKPGSRRYPPNGQLSCPGCDNKIDMAPMRAAAEQQVGRPALNPQPKS
jgi:ATP-dependent protease ClpP protease subunit